MRDEVQLVDNQSEHCLFRMASILKRRDSVGPSKRRPIWLAKLRISDAFSDMEGDGGGGWREWEVLDEGLAGFFLLSWALNLAFFALLAA